MVNIYKAAAVVYPIVFTTMMIFGIRANLESKEIAEGCFLGALLFGSFILSLLWGTGVIG